jgi:hypothetical protein
MLLTGQYPATDDQQGVHLDLDYPDVPNELNRWLPLVKWILAIPHYIVLVVLLVIGFFAVVIAWFAILFTGVYPAGLFRFVVGVFGGGSGSRPMRSSCSRTNTRPSASIPDHEAARVLGSARSPVSP